MDRHAYCILAHNEPDVFRHLVGLLDDSRNDIFVHVDKNTSMSSFKDVKCENSSLFFLSDRIHCGWGSIHLVRAEMKLFRAARENGPYAYYHLVSGVDLPLQRQDVIHGFTDNHPGMNYLGFDRKASAETAIRSRTEQYHFLTRRPGGTKKDIIMSRLNTYSLSVQDFFHVRRHYPFRLFKGSQWVSITDEFCNFLLSREKEVLSIFKYTRCPDEMFIHSVFMDSPFAETLFRPDGSEFDQCMREIDWVRGSPYTWKDEDYEYLMKSDRWFARKFSSENRVILDRIYTNIKSSDI